MFTTETRVKIGRSKVQVKKYIDLPVPTLPKEYTRTSIYNKWTGEKVGECKPIDNEYSLSWDCRINHYPKYYSGFTNPIDTENIMKTYFLVFNPGSKFELISSSVEINPEIHVLGGMSSLGYGLFHLNTTL